MERDQQALLFFQEKDRQRRYVQQSVQRNRQMQPRQLPPSQQQLWHSSRESREAVSLFKDSRESSSPQSPVGED